ncbi:aminoglycoside phosphotransferase family protein [Arthrobacter sp. FW306-05-C]|uniref:phosphotransferase family protein n=1 Tax=Arthrobacter sp. FW306-05-C TaxID=2879620 RepID=UPI001F43A599|nr:phosphotransferase [Arthrobacter sp. FW306-05-C]UKA68383.1 aminoglycoside phosphotransferase family protein [Arthrobacter sp. FW306-05-C]
MSAWLQRPELIADLSWRQLDTQVLQVRAAGSMVIVKAAGPANHHIGREITAHTSYTRPLVERARAGRMLHSSRDLNLLVLEYLDGEPLENTVGELAEDVHFQAGGLLKALHAQERRVDEDYEFRETAKSVNWLDKQHRIEPAMEREVRCRLAEYRPQPVDVVPTHGDWQPRNWLTDRGTVKAIDFGRFHFRPAATDFCRLTVQQWQQAPSLEAAFLRGYGEDPRSQSVWRMNLLREAVGTAVWARFVGDEAFESQGHRMLHQALQNF